MDIADIKENGLPVLLFGCADLGRYAKKVLEYYGIDIEGYISNTLPEYGRYGGKPVWIPQQAAEKFKHAYIGVCIFSDETEQKITAQLQSLGFSNFIKKDCFIHDYLSQGLKPMGIGYKGGKEKISAYFTIHITDYCSLKCKYCGAFSPYVKNPRHYTVDECMIPVRNMLRVVDEIDCLTIQGGEVFLNPHFTEICRQSAALDQVKRIHIPSNATVLPQPEFFQAVEPFKDKLEFRISDYGLLNKRYSEFMQMCEAYGIAVVKTLVGEYWEKPMLPVRQNRTKEANRNLYMTCESCQICPFMIGGRLYKCETAGIREHMGWIPRNEEDSIDFNCVTVSAKELREKVIRFFTDTKAIDACDYCYSNCVKIGKAEQITEPDWTIENLK